MLRFLVSVVIPAYNAERWICRAIDSVLAQTLSPLEILVVDDGSSDNTAAVCSRYGDQIRLLQQWKTLKVVARNFGVAEAQGEWIAFLTLTMSGYLQNLPSNGRK